MKGEGGPVPLPAGNQVPDLVVYADHEPKCLVFYMYIFLVAQKTINSGNITKSFFNSSILTKSPEELFGKKKCKNPKKNEKSFHI